MGEKTEKKNVQVQRVEAAPVTVVRDVMPDQNVLEIDLVELFFTLLANWKSLLLGLLVGAVLFGGYHTLFVKSMYQANTELYITSNNSMISLQDLQIGTALTEDYQFIITSRSVLNQVIEDLALDTTYDRFRRMVSVTNPTGTHIIRTGVTTGDFELSRDIANDLLRVSIERIFQVVGTNEPSVIDYSEVQAVRNVTPSLIKYMAIGGLIGFLLVAAVLVIRMLMNNTIRSEDDVEKYLQLPVLSAVPYYQTK